MKFKKILLFVLVLLILIFLPFSNSNAIEIVYNENTYDLGAPEDFNNYDYYILLCLNYGSENLYMLLLSDSNFYINSDDSGKSLFIATSSDNFKRYDLMFNKSTFAVGSWTENTSKTKDKLHSVNSGYLLGQLVYSSHDLYNLYGGNTLFFNRTPIPYSNFPYILNVEEDLAKGEQDIIIMPR